MLRRLYHQGILVDPLRRFIGCVPEECPGRYAEASGLRAVGPSTPPVFLGFSRDEVLPRNQGRRLDRELAAAGVDHVTYEMPGDAHSVGLLGRLFDETVNFFRDTL
jgi:acetyl esterase/lipase